MSLAQRPRVSPVSPPRPAHCPLAPLAQQAAAQHWPGAHQTHEKGSKASPQDIACLVPPGGGSRQQLRACKAAQACHCQCLPVRACVLASRTKRRPMHRCRSTAAAALRSDAHTHPAPAPSRASVLRGRRPAHCSTATASQLVSIHAAAGQAVWAQVVAATAAE